jgi:hypothetical protein
VRIHFGSYHFCDSSAVETTILGANVELLLWLEQLQIWRLQREEKEVMFGKRNDKITEHTTYVPNQVPPKHMLDRVVEEYKRGQLAHLEQDDDPTVQSIMNEVKVRANDDARHGRRR